MTMIRQRTPLQDAARLVTAAGVTLSYDTFGHGTPLVLVHGSFTDHRTNWQFVADSFARHFTVYALTRRGRGDTDATQGHSVEDEAADVAALIRKIDSPVSLLGHSYGAQVALAAAREVSSRIERLVLYEAPVMHIVSNATAKRLEEAAQAENWERFSATFFREVLSMTADDLEDLRQSPLWPQILADAPRTFHDVRAQRRYDFDPHRFAELRVPVTLQIGSESPRSLYATDALLAVLPNVRVQELPGQGHDAMLLAPDIYASQVQRILQA